MAKKEKILEEEILKLIPKELQPREEEWEKADEKLAVYALTQGYTKDNVPFWAYLAIPPSKYVAFKTAEQDGNFTLSDYGEVLAMGIGYNPPNDIMEKMETEFGVNHNFEEEIITVAEEYVKEQQVIDKYSGKKGLPKRDKEKKDREEGEGGE